MPKSEEDFLLIRRYITQWVTEIVISNATGYFDINRISEGTVVQLLNLVYGYNLTDLNSEKFNYPGIDLGDNVSANIAVQVTSQFTTTKILKTLKIFVSTDYKKTYHNGLMFFIINNKRKSKIKTTMFKEFSDIFNPATGIIYPEDLIVSIKDIYYTDNEKFNTIKNFLSKEFDRINIENKNNSIISFKNSLEKISFYKSIFYKANNTTNLVHFTCIINENERKTENLVDQLNDEEGLLLIGPSGCGKSIISKNIACEFVEKDNVSVILECKYYNGNFNTWLENTTSFLGIGNSLDLFKLSSDLQRTILLVIDGLNECSEQKRIQLIAELEKLKQEWAIKIVISIQKPDSIVESLNLLTVDIPYPSEKIKTDIAAKYNSYNIKGLESILNIVSTSLEAKMIGEIKNFEDEVFNKFTLFGTFIKQKLHTESDSFSLMIEVADFLSKKLSFSLSERELELIIRENSLNTNSFNVCYAANFLENNFGQVSFSHEMFLNFFIAESICRTSVDSLSIVQAINLPKNYDKKILIVGAISDTDILNNILSEIDDTNLIRSLIDGEAGLYCQSWCERELFKVLDEIETEIDNLKFIVSDNELYDLAFDVEKLKDWTSKQYAYIYVIPYKLNNEKVLKRFLELTITMDDRIVFERKRLGKAIDDFFALSYVGFTKETPAITKILNNLHSGLLSFDQKIVIPNNIIAYLENKKSYTDGEFYFILGLLIYNKKLSLFFSHIAYILKNKWKELPYHFKLSILLQINCFPTNETDRNTLINILNHIDEDSNNIWISSSITDALNQLGAFEDDIENHIPIVTDQIDRLLLETGNEKNCEAIFSIYNCATDHPYCYSYQVAIENMEINNKEIFFERAVRGMKDVFCASYLVIKTSNIIGGKICPHIVKWTENPLPKSSMMSDSLHIFLLSHILLAKYQFPVTSRFATEINLPKKSFFAAAEIYYWFNRLDLTLELRKMYSKNAIKVLFDRENRYSVSVISHLRNSSYQPFFSLNDFDNSFKESIEDWFPDNIINICRNSLNNLNYQQPAIPFGNDTIIQTIDILARIGSIIDIDVLKILAEDKKYGESAVKAIKQLVVNKK